MKVAANDYVIDYGDGDDDEVITDDGKDNVDSQSFLPDIRIKDTDDKKRKPLNKKNDGLKDENMFIYKDFDTSLTKVGGNKNYHPAMQKTTSVRGEDLIRDRLLTFKYKNGQVETQIGKDKRKDNKSPPKRKVVQYAQYKTGQRYSSNLVHKAFWVHNIDEAKATSHS